MKKLISVLSVLAILMTMTFTFSACGDDEPTAPNNPTNYEDDNGGYGGQDDNGGYGNQDDNGGYGGQDDNGGNTSADETPNAPTGVRATVEGPKKYPYVLVKWDLDWSANSWNVYRSTQGGSFKKIGSNVSNSYGDESVKQGTQYSYKVTAVGKNGKESGYSSEVSVYVEPYFE